MMKITILAVNSQYIHASLAPWYLKAALGGGPDVTVLESSVNEPVDDVVQQVYDTAPDVLCACCYIWNIAYVQRVCEELSLLLPSCKILWGGPEVSFCAEQTLASNPFVYAVLCGEGEEALPALIRRLDDPNGLPGVLYRVPGGIAGDSTYQCIPDLSLLPSPYTPEMCAAVAGRIAYYESSRGCPFSCAYCLSSAVEGVRYFPLERVKRELRLLSAAGARTLKFTDRTFNAYPARSAELLDFLIRETGDTCIHLEIGADLIDERWFRLLADAPPGKLRLEAGVQSTNPRVLADVARSSDVGQLLENLKKILSLGNICVHADLICGLPGEDFASFRRSFNDLYALRPHELQMGFLKLLHGARLRERADKEGVLYSRRPPYMVYATPHLSRDQLFALRELEDGLEKYYNSGKFTKTLDYLLAFFPSPFDFYQALAEFIRKNGLRYARLSASSLFELLHSFGGSIQGLDAARLQTFLKFDYFSCGFSGGMPAFLREDLPPEFRERCFALLRDDAVRTHFFSAYSALSPKEIYKQVRFIPFAYDVTLPGAPAGDLLMVFDPQSRSRVDGRISPKIIK